MNHDFADLTELNQVLSAQNTFALIEQYFVSDETFIEHLDNTVMQNVSLRLNDMTVDERLTTIRRQPFQRLPRIYPASVDVGSHASAYEKRNPILH